MGIEVEVDHLQTMSFSIVNFFRTMSVPFKVLFLKKDVRPF